MDYGGLRFEALRRLHICPMFYDVVLKKKCYYTVQITLESVSRINAKFKNKLCFSCKIFPLCLGGCSQQALEHDGIEYCIYKEENEKDRIIETKIDKILDNNKKNIVSPLIKKKNLVTE